MKMKKYILTLITIVSLNVLTPATAAADTLLPPELTKKQIISFLDAYSNLLKDSINSPWPSLLKDALANNKALWCVGEPCDSAAYGPFYPWEDVDKQAILDRLNSILSDPEKKDELLTHMQLMNQLMFVSMDEGNIERFNQAYTSIEDGLSDYVLHYCISCY